MLDTNAERRIDTARDILVGKVPEPKDFAMGLIGFGKDVEKSLLEATSPFVFSTVNERSILRFLKLIAVTTARSAPMPSWWTTATSPPIPMATSSKVLRPR